MRRLLWLSYAIACVCLAHSAMAAEPVIAPGAMLTKLSGGYVFTEGACSDPAGDVYFTDQPNDRILKWHPADAGKPGAGVTTFLQPAGRCNGLCVDADGNIWGCADERNELWRITPWGAVTRTVAGYGGKLLNGPNDVWVCPGGGEYVTDPYYRRPYWKRGPMEQDVQGVYYLPPGGKTLVRVIDDLKAPNGIVGTPDGKTLCVSDVADRKTFAYDIGADGRLSRKRVVIAQGSDGMTIDIRGNIYLTYGGTVTAVDPTGVVVAEIPLPAGHTASNVCFGGADRRTLFVTAGDSVYTVRMLVAGVGSQ